MSDKVMPIAPSWTWGSSQTLKVDASTAPGPPPYFDRGVSAQLAQVSLPEPAVCTIYFQVSVTSTDPLDTIRVFTVNLNEGVGRVTVPRQMSFMNQPSVGSPLEFTIPFIPLHALNVDIEVVVDVQSADPLVQVTTYLVLAPLTRIEQKKQELTFGMELPGEADSLDDALLEELEADAPSVAEALAADFEPPEEEERVRVPPPWLMHLTKRLGRRLGRPPTRDELAKAVVARQRRLTHGGRS